MSPAVPRLSIACLLLASFTALAATTSSATAPAAKTAKPVQKKAGLAPKPRPLPAGPPVAGPEQMEAAALVYYGLHECEFNQSLEIGKNTRHAGYVDVKHGKAIYLMKPVLSSTGALRLEDTKGLTMLVQIATKSMLMNVKAGQRIVDDCVGAQQREAIETARQAKAAEEQREKDAAQAAAAAASAVPAPEVIAPPEAASVPAASASAASSPAGR